jgi:NarL family two-component system response regulator LiaR
VVVDDHEIARAGIRTLLGREHDIHIVGMAASGEDALGLIEEVHPDVVVVDYSLPSMSGVELCEEIAKRHPNIPVIMLTSFLEDEVVRRSLDAGAQAYIYKDAEGRELRKAVHAVAGGQSVLDSRIAGRVISWAQKESKRKLPTKGPILSKREIDVLRLIAKGDSDKEIADQLSLSINTVKTHVSRMLWKLECRTRAEAATLASKWKIL